MATDNADECRTPQLPCAVAVNVGLGCDLVSCVEKEVFLRTPRPLDDALDPISNCPPCTFQQEVKFIGPSAGASQRQQARFGFDPKQFPAAGAQPSGMFSNTVATGIVRRESSFSIIRYKFCGANWGARHTSFQRFEALFLPNSVADVRRSNRSRQQMCPKPFVAPAAW